MSNAKRRHRRRWYRQQRWAHVLRIEAELAAQGYAYKSTDGARRYWSRQVPEEELRRLKPGLRWLFSLPAFAEDVQWVEVP